jgi:GTPase involved in cell partitioning and DNA repair
MKFIDEAIIEVHAGKGGNGVAETVVAAGPSMRWPIATSTR